MKATGIARQVDSLGRVVFPMELRRTMDINSGDAMEIFTDGKTIVLKKYEPACIFCGEAGDVVEHKGKYVCNGCLEEMGK